MEIQVVQNVLKANDEFAQLVRKRLAETEVVALNLMSAPGSGKTSLLEATSRTLAGRLPFGVVEGDPDTTRDAERIARCGVPVVQINTAGGCHLDANLVFRALQSFDLAQLRLLFIENVGNLVCPAGFDLGEKFRVALVSTPEGHDKPAKYPKLFRRVHAVVLNKIDLLSAVDFDEDQFHADLRQLNPDLALFRISCRTGEGLAEWTAWLERATRGD